MTVTNLNSAVEQLVARAEASKVERQLAMLNTQTGANKFLSKKDGTILEGIVKVIENATEKPLFTGYTYPKNVETIISIASALQYMKGEYRDQIPEVVWSVFDADTRSEIINAYGRLPYLADSLSIEIDGKHIEVDPDARERARNGIKPDCETLEVLVNTVAIELGLLGDYACDQQRADLAWEASLRKVAKAQILDSYKDSL